MEKLIDRLQREAREKFITKLVMDMSWINKPDYDQTLEQLSDTLITHTLEAVREDKKEAVRLGIALALATVGTPEKEADEIIDHATSAVLGSDNA